MSIEAERLYAEREQRFNDVVHHVRPDRVPVITSGLHYFATKIKGISNKDAGYDSRLRMAALREATVEFGWEMCPFSGIAPSKAHDALGALQFRWPGGNLADDAPYQFVEGEYVKEDEYDEFLDSPNGFTMTKILPRIFTKLSGLGQIPLPPLYWLSNSHTFEAMAGSLLSLPPLRTALEALLELADVFEEENAIQAEHAADMKALGYPMVCGGITVPAFDLVSDYFRGLKGSSLDLYRSPDKLRRAIDVMRPAAIGSALLGAQVSGNPRVLIPMHRGADGFLSEEHFAEFYWPSFKELIETLVDNGLVPIPVFEGRYTSRLKYLAELPAGKVVGLFQHVDRQKFKEICGDVLCFWGNVPASLMCAGTPQEVKDDVKRLIDIFGDTGSLIIDSTQGIPDESRPENVYALREAVDEYGVF